MGWEEGSQTLCPLGWLMNQSALPRSPARKYLTRFQRCHRPYCFQKLIVPRAG